MKTFAATLLFAFLISNITISAQNAFHDAQFLVESRVDILRFNDSVRLYMRRFSDSLTSTEKATVLEVNSLAKFISNPFSDSIPVPKFEIASKSLKEVTKIITKLQKLAGHDLERNMVPSSYSERNMGQLRNISGASLTEIPSSSLLSASQIIDGTALFIKKRVREELKVAFLNQFKQKLDNDPLFARLLPSTFRTFQSIAELDNQMPSLNNVALNAFQADIEQLPENIEAALLYDAEFEEVRHNANFKYFALPFNTIKHFQLGSHPAFALQDVQSKYFKDRTELDRIIQMMVVLNDNLRATEQDEMNVRSNDDDSKITFIDNSSWSSLRKKGGDSLFMALIYRNFKDSLFTEISTKPLAEVRTKMRILGENISDYLANLNAFEILSSNLKDEANRQNRDSLALQLTWNVMQLIDKSHLIYFSMLDKKAQESYKNNYWLTYKPIAEATLKATAALQKRNYAGAVLNTFQILRGLSDIPSLKSRGLFQSELLKNFFFYGNFMTDILTAYNSEEVASILDRYAAPVGSYSLKRKAKFSVSLNAYPGLFVAVEDPLGGGQVTGLKRWGFVSGVTAPIGISFNWGSYGKKSDQNVSIFVSAIDIGAVLSYRWSNDVAEGLPNDVEWAQVLSPGLHLMYGISNLPITLSAGYQISPRLRQVVVTTGKNENRNFERITLGLMVDVTIFNFYKTGKRRKQQNNLSKN